MKRTSSTKGLELAKNHELSHDCIVILHSFDLKIIFLFELFRIIIKLNAMAFFSGAARKTNM